MTSFHKFVLHILKYRLCSKIRCFRQWCIHVLLAIKVKTGTLVVSVPLQALTKSIQTHRTLSWLFVRRHTIWRVDSASRSDRRLASMTNCRSAIYIFWSFGESGRPAGWCIVVPGRPVVRPGPARAAVIICRRQRDATAVDTDVGCSSSIIVVRVLRPDRSTTTTTRPVTQRRRPATRRIHRWDPEQCRIYQTSYRNRSLQAYDVDQDRRLLVWASFMSHELKWIEVNWIGVTRSVYLPSFWF